MYAFLRVPALLGSRIHAFLRVPAHLGSTLYAFLRVPAGLGWALLGAVWEPLDPLWVKKGPIEGPKGLKKTPLERCKNAYILLQSLQNGCAEVPGSMHFYVSRSPSRSPW